MREYPTNSPMEKRYSIKAFQFRDTLKNQSTVVFIQVIVDLNIRDLKIKPSAIHFFFGSD